jgi:hypothetical protein
MAKAIIEPRKILTVIYCMYSCFSIFKEIKDMVVEKIPHTVESKEIRF